MYILIWITEVKGQSSFMNIGRGSEDTTPVSSSLDLQHHQLKALGAKIQQIANEMT